jgi:y4mF family transcriptional regulator
MFPIGKLVEAMALGDALLPDRADSEDMGVTPVRAVQDLGSALRQARKALHLTQSELALAAGVGVRFLVELEAGKPTVRLEHVLRVIDALGGSLQLSGLAGEIGRGR